MNGIESSVENSERRQRIVKFVLSLGQDYEDPPPRPVSRGRGRARTLSRASISVTSHSITPIDEQPEFNRFSAAAAAGPTCEQLAEASTTIANRTQQEHQSSPRSASLSSDRSIGKMVQPHLNSVSDELGRSSKSVQVNCIEPALQQKQSSNDSMERAKRTMSTSEDEGIEVEPVKPAENIQNYDLPAVSQKTYRTYQVSASVDSTGFKSTFTVDKIEAPEDLNASPRRTVAVPSNNTAFSSFKKRIGVPIPENGDPFFKKEIMTHVFSFLPLKCRVRSMIVCRNWRCWMHFRNIGTLKISDLFISSNCPKMSSVRIGVDNDNNNHSISHLEESLVDSECIIQIITWLAKRKLSFECLDLLPDRRAVVLWVPMLIQKLFDIMPGTLECLKFGGLFTTDGLKYMSSNYADSAGGVVNLIFDVVITVEPHRDEDTFLCLQQTCEASKQYLASLFTHWCERGKLKQLVIGNTVPFRYEGTRSLLHCGVMPDCNAFRNAREFFECRHYGYLLQNLTNVQCNNTLQCNQDDMLEFVLKNAMNLTFLQIGSLSFDMPIVVSALRSVFAIRVNLSDQSTNADDLKQFLSAASKLPSLKCLSIKITNSTTCNLGLVQSSLIKYCPLKLTVLVVGGITLGNSFHDNLEKEWLQFLVRRPLLQIVSLPWLHLNYFVATPNLISVSLGYNVTKVDISNFQQRRALLRDKKYKFDKYTKIISNGIEIAQVY